jgi:hypothetical protein
MEIDENFKEHISGIFIDLCDLEPMQQRYRTDTLINENDEVSLIEFIKIFYSAINKKIDIDLASLEHHVSSDEENELESDQHPKIVVPYGPAFLVLYGDPDLVKEFKLDQYPNPGIRLLVAHFTQDSRILDLLSYDRCVMVRAEVACNKTTSGDTIERLKEDPFVYVRNLVDGEVMKQSEGDESLIANLDIELCVCFETEINEGFDDFFSTKHSLDYPPITLIFEEEITEFGFWNWATQPFPTRWQDYSLNESVEYLKGPIPDQYSLNHAGHGVNSYSLNFRHALGNLAIFAQCGHGGAYMDSNSNSWDELQQRLCTVLLDNADWNSDEIRTRKYLLVYSDFRIGKEPELWQNNEGTWVHVETVRSWEDVSEFLKIHNG